MNYILTAATAVSKEAGSMSEMLPKFGGSDYFNRHVYL